jgi:uncharacterized membrane protein
VTFISGIVVGVVIGVVGMAAVVWMVAGIVQHLVELAEAEALP